MGNIKKVNIKNRTYYFFDDMINIKDFDSNLLKIDKKSYKNIDWIKSYLSNRNQYVSINAFDSALAAINFGVLQGSVLGPFYIYYVQMYII